MNSDNQLLDRHGKRKYLNINERIRFYEEASLLSDLKRKTFALTIFHTGCRISEALSLTPASIDAAEVALVFRTLKQHGRIKYRAIPIPDDLLALLRRQCMGLAPSDPLWSFCRTTGWSIVKKCMKASKLEGTKACPKGLRHGFAIALASKGVVLPTVQRLLGHSSLQTTSIYLDFTGPEERDLVSRVWPGWRGKMRLEFCRFWSKFRALNRTPKVFNSKR